MSEIDDIFASKATNLPPSLPSSSKSSEKAKKQKKNKKKKKKKGIVEDVASTEPIDLPASTTSKKRPAPETVVDTSDLLEAPAKRHKGFPVSHEDDDSKPRKSTKKISDDDANFQDSRGTGNRRTTEEGWLVYKEDELGISGEGGGKLLYVHTGFRFTSTSNQTLHYVHSIVIVVSERFFCNLSSLQLSPRDLYQKAWLFRSLSNRTLRFEEVNL